MPNAIEYVRQNKDRFRSELEALLRIPSVSTAPERKGEMEQAANWVAAELKKLGFDGVKLMPTGGHPLVYAEYMKAGAGAPTVLLYAHYDVQPAEPLDLWTTGAFEPTVRGENLYARGASDMKGELMALLKAIEALLRSGQGLAVNLKCMFEGEEEIGSPHLAPTIAANKALFKADFCLNVDGGILAPDCPSITYGLRGIAYFEINVTGPVGDLHSGIFGGAVHNPATVLCELIAGMHDAEGRVTLPGFYDKVRALSAEERGWLAKLPANDAWWMEKSGAPALFGEAGYSSTERASARPTLDVNGFLTGYTGKGSKTVLPSKAMAKVSMRLVPDQDPDEIRTSLERYLKEKAPPTITWTVDTHSSSRASIMARDSVAVRAASAAFEAVWGKAPLFKREGGSVPVVGQIQDLLGMESLLVGFGLPDDNLHAPNEKLHLPTWYRGIEVFVHFFEQLRKK